MTTIEALQCLQEKTKAEVFYVGGFVRDYARGKKNDDIDIVVRKLDMKYIIKFLSDLGMCKKVQLEETIEILLFRATDDKTVAQITLPRRNLQQIADKNNTLRQDAKYRDFYINAMYLPLDFKSKKDIIDPLERGRMDLTQGVINTYHLDLFKMSPIRLLRMVSLAARTGYKIDNYLLGQARHDGHLLVQAPAELLRKEFNKILLSKKPSKSLKLLNRLHLLHIVAPELAACVNVTQDTKFHKYDVFTHCIYTCDNTEPDIVMRLAGLLHDIGKAGTRKKIGNRVTFHKHEMLSVKLAKSLLNRLRYDGKTKTAVLNLVRLHMYHYTREYGNNAVRRFIKKVDITEDQLDSLGDLPLFKLRQAERLGNGLKSEPVTQRQLDFEERIKQVFRRGAGLTIKDLDIDGNIIKEAFEVDEGLEVGKILEHLLSQVQRNKALNERLTLIELVLKHIRKIP
jgi:tRNA nucleotidyltransferase (CCA-adding enzyme)